MPQYVVKPFAPEFVMERRRYIKDGENPFTIDLYYESVTIFMDIDEKPVIELEDRAFGYDINKYLKDKYPNCTCETQHGHCLGKNSPDMPECLREKMDEKYNEYAIWDCFNDCQWVGWAMNDYDWVLDYPVELWVYTEDFTVKFNGPPPSRPPSPPEDTSQYVYCGQLEPLEEVKIEV